MDIAKNWIKGGILLIAIPCAVFGAISMGMLFHILGVAPKKTEKHEH